MAAKKIFLSTYAHIRVAHTHFLFLKKGILLSDTKLHPYTSLTYSAYKCVPTKIRFSHKNPVGVKLKDKETARIADNHFWGIKVISDYNLMRSYEKQVL